jgi:L-alanine-DL-glutamate epimerase-like enolase superfamily enzyme
VRYKKQVADEALPLLKQMGDGVSEADIDDIEHHEQRAREIAPEHSSARCAFDIALWDAAGKKAGKPLYELWGAPKPTDIQTSHTVGLNTHEVMVERTREAAHMPILKIKLGRDRDFDLKVMQLIREAAPDAQLRIDANAGWTLDTALDLIPKLADLGVDLIEQPLAIGNLDETRKLREQSPLPIILDEDAQDMSSLPALRGLTDGINIKLMKCGGLSEARRMIDFARNEGWKIFVGCMIETRLALGAAAHLAGLVDYLDLDAYMLTTNDPFPGGSLAEYSPEPPLPEGPGVGFDWPLVATN